MLLFGALVDLDRGARRHGRDLFDVECRLVVVAAGRTAVDRDRRDRGIESVAVEERREVARVVRAQLVDGDRLTRAGDVVRPQRVESVEQRELEGRVAPVGVRRRREFAAIIRTRRRERAVREER